MRVWMGSIALRRRVGGALLIWIGMRVGVRRVLDHSSWSIHGMYAILEILCVLVSVRVPFVSISSIDRGLLLLLWQVVWVCSCVRVMLSLHNLTHCILESSTRIEITFTISSSGGGAGYGWCGLVCGCTQAIGCHDRVSCCFELCSGIERVH